MGIAQRRLLVDDCVSYYQMSLPSSRYAKRVSYISLSHWLLQARQRARKKQLMSQMAPKKRSVRLQEKELQRIQEEREMSLKRQATPPAHAHRVEVAMVRKLSV